MKKTILALSLITNFAFANTNDLNLEIKTREGVIASRAAQIEYLDEQIAEIDESLPSTSLAISIPVELGTLAVHGLFISGGLKALTNAIMRPLILVQTGYVSFKVTRLIEGKLTIREINKIREIAVEDLNKNKEELFDLSVEKLQGELQECMDNGNDSKLCVQSYEASKDELAKRLE